MVRINLIRKRYLADQHLNAEWDESFMLLGHMLKFPFSIDKVPLNYCLGTGHIKFFTDKARFVFRNLEMIGKEMERRGFKPNWDLYWDYYDRCSIKLGMSQWNDYKPSKDDEVIIIIRLIEKHELKPNYYKYCGKLLNSHKTFILLYKLLRVYLYRNIYIFTYL